MISGVNFRGACTCYVCCCWVGRDGTLAHWVTHSVGVSPRTPWQAPERVVVFTLLAWLRAQVSPSVVHVDWYTNG